MLKLIITLQLYHTIHLQNNLLFHMKKIFFLLIATASFASAAFTLTSGAVSNLADEDNVALTSATTYAVLVALNDDPFDGLIMSDTISIGQTVGEGKYYVLQVSISSDPGGSFGQAGQVNVNNFNTTGTPLANNAALGNQVAFVWFPGQSSGSGTELSAGDSYGVIRGSDWLLPTDLGGSISYSNFVVGNKQATFTVQVPEPTGLALISLGAVALIARRRRV